MKKSILWISLSLAGLVALIAVPPMLTEGQSQQVDPTVDQPIRAKVVATPSSILEAVNVERSKVGVAPLTLHPNVTKSAQLKADDMYNRGYHSHYLPEDPSATLTQEMYSYISEVCSASSENLVIPVDQSPTDTELAMSGWMKSPAHKEAILDPRYTYTGVGVSHGIVVQHFCVAY